MDVKRTFDNISKKQLLNQIIELESDGDLVTYISSFLSDRKIQLVIDRHDNKERDIETRIPQGSLMSLFFFLIYISQVFNKISETSFSVISLLFFDNMGFIAFNSSIKRIVKVLGKIVKEIIK